MSVRRYTEEGTRTLCRCCSSCCASFVSLSFVAVVVCSSTNANGDVSQKQARWSKASERPIRSCSLTLSDTHEHGVSQSCLGELRGGFPRFRRRRRRRCCCCRRVSPAQSLTLSLAHTHTHTHTVAHIPFTHTHTHADAQFAKHTRQEPQSSLRFGG